MHTNRQIFWDGRPAPAARLGRIGRVHGDHLSTSFFRFVLKHLPEQSKTCIVGGQGQVAVSVHKAEDKVLDSDQVIFSNQAGADLVKMIGPLVGDLFVHLADLPVGFPLALTAFDLPGSVALQAAQFCKAFPQPAGIVDTCTARRRKCQFASRESRKAFQANVNANLPTSGGAVRFGAGQVQHETDVPAVVDLLDHSVLEPRPGWDCPVVAHSYFACVLDVATHAPVLIGSQLAAVAVGVLQALEPAAALEPRKARLLACLQAVEESSEGFIQTTKHMLQARSIQLAECVRMIVAQVSKMCPLCTITKSLATLLVGHYPLFKGGIVDKPGLPQQEVKLSSLLVIRAKEVLVGTQHRLSMPRTRGTRFLHFDVALDGFLRDLADRPNVVASAPQAWKPGAQLRKLLAQPPRSVSLELVCKPLRRFGWVALNEQVNVVRHDLKRLDRRVQFLRLLMQQGSQFIGNLSYQHLAPVFGTPDEVIFQRENTACVTSIPWVTHKPSVRQYSIVVNYLI
jgi:hypothetical protein